MEQSSSELDDTVAMLTDQLQAEKARYERLHGQSHDDAAAREREIVALKEAAQARAGELAALREENLEMTEKGRALEEAARAREFAMAAREEELAATVQAGVAAVEELKRELVAAERGREEADLEREAGTHTAAALQVLQKSPAKLN